MIDEKTMLIAADTPQNRKTYEDLVIRTFFLSNGDVTEVSNALRALLQTTRISINKSENSITLRDTADKVAIAERIIEQNDKQLSEVVVDVELLQINTKAALDLGPRLPALLGLGEGARSGRDEQHRRDHSGRAVHLGPVDAALDQLVRVHDPVGHLQLHQEQHRTPSCSPSRSCESPRGRRRSSSSATRRRFP